jgi:hypothetical protein
MLVPLNAANENVLMAVRACADERVYSSPVEVAERTKPRLSFAETKVFLHLLACDGYAFKREHGFYGDAYILTERGAAEAGRVALLGEGGSDA